MKPCSCYVAVAIGCLVFLFSGNDGIRPDVHIRDRPRMSQVNDPQAVRVPAIDYLTFSAGLSFSHDLAKSTGLVKNLEHTGQRPLVKNTHEYEGHESSRKKIPPGRMDSAKSEGFDKPLGDLEVHVTFSA